MNTLQLTLFLFILIIVGAIPTLLRSFLQARIQKAIQQGDFAKANSLLSQKMTQILLGQSYTLWQQIKCQMAQQKDPSSLATAFLATKLKSEQRIQALQTLLSYAIEQDFNALAESYYHQLIVLVQGQQRQFVTCLYETLVKQSSQHIDWLKAQEPNGIFLYLLGVAYDNAHQPSQAKPYYQKAKTKLKNTPFEKKIKRRLSCN